MLLGIDYSINSPAICVLQDEITFFSFPRVGSIKESTMKSLIDCQVIVKEVPAEPKNTTKGKVAEFERHYFRDCLTQTEIISNELPKGENPVVAFEGFSFASNGNRLAQLSGYQYMLRWRLHDEHCMQFDDLHIYSPMTVKSTAGKGNFKKEQMIDAFIASDDERLRNTSFWKAISQSPELFQTKTGKWVKPIDDIVDSYWVLRTLEKNNL